MTKKNHWCTSCHGFPFAVATRTPDCDRCWRCGGTGLREEEVLLEQEAEFSEEEVNAERINDRVISGFYFGGPE